VRDLVLFFYRHLGEGFSSRRVVKNRVVTEPVSTSRFLGELAMDLAYHFDQVIG
jgi:hypothetical protein